ncbi:MAG TPA: hypothetical protein VEI97_19555 [bacterium]|nr:hypothetical protein [bacterium]
MRTPLRHSSIRLLLLLLLPTLAITTGAKGEGLAAGCFRRPTFAHDRGLTHLSDIVVLATAAPDTIQLYSVAQARVTNTLKAADRLQDMAVSALDPNGRRNPRAYVVSKSAHVAAYDLRQNSILADIPLSDDPEASGGSVAVSPNGRYVAVGRGDREFQIRSVAVLNAAQLDQVVASVEFNGDLQDLVANPNPEFPELYIVNDKASKIRIYNFETQQYADSIFDLTGSPSAFVVSPDGRLAMASINARNKVVFVDLTTKVLFYEVILSGRNPGELASPHQIAFTPDGSTAYVTDRRVRGLLYRIDLGPIRRAMAGQGDLAGIDQSTVVTAKQMPFLLTDANFIPEKIAVSADSNFMYVAGSNATHFSVINLRPVSELAQADPAKFGFLPELVQSQARLAPPELNDGLYEVQGINLAKDPVTLGVLYGASDMVFRFTDPKEGEPATPAE